MTRFTALFAAFAALVATGCQEEIARPLPVEESEQAEVLESVDLDIELATVQTPAVDPCDLWETPGQHTLIVPGFEDRPALMYVPETAGPRDAVVMLHGAHHTGAQERTITRYHLEAMERDMVAVFPDGVDEVWRAGFTSWKVDDGGIDDVAYLSALSDALADQVCVDRVLAAGFSNGSMMAQRWACEGTGVDAVVAAGGARLEHTCPNPAVPIVISHGRDDARVTYDGSPSPQTGRAWPSVRDTTESWLDHNGWDGALPTETANGPITCLEFSGDAETTLCSIEGWGHRWPGGLNTRFAPQYDLTAHSLDWFQAL